MFDIRILVLSTMLVSFTLLIEMIALARIFPRQNYLKFLIASYLLLTLAMLGWVLRGVLPDFISIVVAGFLIAAKYYINIYRIIIIWRYLEIIIFDILDFVEVNTSF